MEYDFDTIHQRTNSNSIKWDFMYKNGVLQQRKTGDDPLAADSLLPMWVADMDFAIPQPVIDALTYCAKNGIFGYSRPTDGYYESIINWMWRRHDWQVERDWILTTSGVMPAICMLIQTFTEPGDKIIVQTPLFNPIFQAIEENGRVVANNRLLYDNGRYLMDFADLATKAADPYTKMIILCSPHNPVGRVWSHAELHRLGEICTQHDVLIVSDEIHADLTYSWASFTTFGVVDAAFNNRFIFCSSPSKTFNLPGLQTANTIIPNKALREQFLLTLQKMNQLFGYNIFGILALQTAYEQGQEWLTQLIAYLETNYSYLQTYLAEHLPQLTAVRPDALYLIWIDCHALELDSKSLKSLFFEEAKVYLTEGSTYGIEGNGFVRLNIACPRPILTNALERIRHAVNRLD
ncbi:Cystathionine beta-lyase [hydrothermal vent metagenome]|uniref:cysteine-S-conjugate beta-lyase n=1 Tax=hydrothermal vent metagenome TaxID=652676 RepID=A0A3B0VH21_9ZZZZ